MKTDKIPGTALVDIFNIFELLGLDNISRKEKEKYMQKIYRLVLQEFLLKTIILGHDEARLNIIQSMVSRNCNPSQVLEYMSSHLPDFFGSLVKYVRTRKQELVIVYINNLILNLDTRLKTTTSAAASMRIREELKYYNAALEFAEHKQWDKLRTHFTHSYTTTSIPTYEKS